MFPKTTLLQNPNTKFHHNESNWFLNDTEKESCILPRKVSFRALCTTNTHEKTQNEGMKGDSKHSHACTSISDSTKSAWQTAVNVRRENKNIMGCDGKYSAWNGLTTGLTLMSYVILWYCVISFTCTKTLYHTQNILLSFRISSTFLSQSQITRTMGNMCTQNKVSEQLRTLRHEELRDS